MNNKHFTNYLFDKMEQNKSNMSIFASTDKVDIGFNSPNERFNLFITRKGDMMAWNITGYNFNEKHRKAICALVNSHNDKQNQRYKLHVKGDRIMAFDIVQAKDDDAAIEAIEDAIVFFTKDNDVTRDIAQIFTNANARVNIIKSRVDELKTRACAYDNQGEHDKAKRCYFEICNYYGFTHMELVALLYGREKDTKWGRFPDNKEYQLEYLMMAVDKDKDNVIAPMVAYNLASKLGKTELCDKILAIGQERGTWNAVALHLRDGSSKLFERIVNCYRNGIGCEANEAFAKYYERLLSGERQDVFKDMLVQGFEPVLDLMTINDYYKIQSIQDLDGIPTDLKERFLYGDVTDGVYLPDWFAPMVNSLSELERDAVLAEVQTRIKHFLEDFNQNVQSGRYEIIESWDEHDIIWYEDYGTMKCRHLPDLSSVAQCTAIDDIKVMIANLISKI